VALARALPERTRREGARRTVVVEAPAGAGKSRLLDEVMASATMPVSAAGGSRDGLHTPYGVAMDLLGLQLGHPVGADAEQRLFARFDAMVAGGPLLVIVDDAQWADAGSLELVTRMVQASRDLPMAMLLAVRPEPVRPQLTRLVRRPDVEVVGLPPLDAMDLDVLVREHTGHWPGPRLRTLLAASAANPLQAVTTLEDLRRDGAVRTDLRARGLGERLVELVGDASGPGPGSGSASLSGPGLPTVADLVAQRVAQLDGRPREVARALAVCGANTALETLAAVLTVEPVVLVEPAQALVDAGLVVFDGDRLGFSHDAYREAVYEAVPAPLRKVLHVAVAERAAVLDRARHLIAGQASATAVLEAVEQAEEELRNAPAVEADLLEQAAGLPEDDSDVAVRLAAGRARALARSGQMLRAEGVARSALVVARDPAVVGELRRVVIFSLSTRGDVDGALAALGEALAAPLPDRVRQVLAEHQHYVSLMGGRAPLDTPLSDGRPLTLNGIVAEVLRHYLTGATQQALELAWEASRRYGSPEVDPNEGQSVDTWPPLVELAHSGPAGAAAALAEVIRLREERGLGFLALAHQMTAASVDMLGGRLSDAAAQFDAALEWAAEREMGWTSSAVGSRAMIDVWRGEVGKAVELLESAGDIGALFLGLPQPDRARVAILEAERHYREAADRARRVWASVARLGAVNWMTMVAPELARVAVRAADDDLVQQLRAGLADLPRPGPRGLAPSLALADAMLGDPAELSASGVAAAQMAHDIGDRVTELAALEEAACAEAAWGDGGRARELARQTLIIAEECGARGTAARIRGRMRAAGVRLGSTAPRQRPTTGWASLTPTEGQIADLVAAGLTGPEIGDRLHISPRTVQTHVSHVLGKLGLANRVELAAAVAARTARDARDRRDDRGDRGERRSR
jgi:DNA-binding CsgD family transcriptional regulator